MRAIRNPYQAQFGGMSKGNTKLQNYVPLFLYLQVPML